MRPFAVGPLCLLGLLASPAHGQNSRIEPIRVTAGTALTFHLQTRLNPAGRDALDALPRGTLIQVKVLDSIDPSVNPDGSKFHGSMVSSLISGDMVVVHSEAEVRGLLALLRSKSHPEGFRYELLLTGLTDHGKSYALTASLNPSFLDASGQAASRSKAGTKQDP
jgi:hypothetical protein